MDEFSFIDSIQQRFYKQSTLIKGIGDDAAVFRQTTKDIVTAVDTFVENVHFSRQTMKPFHIGYRGLAANISDLAAMAATPAFYLVSVVIPKTWSLEEISEIFLGMESIAETYKMDLIGGDTVSGNELSISITVIGYVKKGQAKYRHTANDGDIVFITGTLGDSQAGFHILMNDGNYINKAHFINKHRMPSPRIDFAKGLVDLEGLALNDISDGIANEAAEIAEASGVHINLYADKIPVQEAFVQFPLDLQYEWKYFGGEDFELLGTVSASNWLSVKEVAKNLGIDVTNIGNVAYNETDVGRVFLHEGNKKLLLKKSGYTHLK